MCLILAREELTIHMLVHDRKQTVGSEVSPSIEIECYNVCECGKDLR